MQRGKFPGNILPAKPTCNISKTERDTCMHNYDQAVDYSTELDTLEDAIAAEAERELFEELSICPEGEDDLGCEKCFFTGENPNTRNCEHGTGDWRGCKQCNVGGWQPGDPITCEHGAQFNDCPSCEHDEFIRQMVLHGECFECHKRLGPDHVCSKCSWDGSDYV